MEETWTAENDSSPNLEDLLTLQTYSVFSIDLCKCNYADGMGSKKMIKIMKGLKTKLFSYDSIVN